MSKVKMDPVAIQEITKLPIVQQALIEAAHLGEAAAFAIAPRSSMTYTHPDYGHYQDSIHVEVYEGDGKVVLIADDFKSNWIEFGTLNPQGTSKGYPAHATLRRGFEAAGFKLHDVRRT